MKGKQKTLSALKKELDRVFNKFIRQRDSKDGFFTCISSGKVLPVSQMNAGHFYSAGHHSALRWDEDNVHGQSIHDNCFLHGNLLGYREGLLKKIGPERLERLEIRKHNVSHYGRFELSLLIGKYKKLIQQ